jgi:hypothetical protein
MQDRPTRTELLEAVRRYLEEDVIPHTSGRRQFLARVSVHALGLVDRELRHEERHLVREWRDLDELLGPSAMPALREEARAALDGRNRELAAAIRSGRFDAASALRQRLLAHLRETTREKLEVADPGLLARDDAEGRG